MMISMFDREGDSQINPYEFEQLWNYLSQWRQTFNSFDADRSGQIDKQELANALRTMGYRVWSMSLAQAMPQDFISSFLAHLKKTMCLPNTFISGFLLRADWGNVLAMS